MPSDAPPPRTDDTGGSGAPDLRRLRIRAAETADHDAILALYNQSVLEGQIHGNDTGADIENLREAYFSDDGDSGFWVACLDEVIVGMIGLQKTRANTAEIRRLRVREDFRRRGIGTKLIQHTIDVCRDRGYLKVILDVRVERGPAIAMFEKCGFIHARTREIGERRLLDFFLDLYTPLKGNDGQS